MARRLLQLFADKRIQRSLLLVLLWLPAVIALLLVREVLLPFLLAFALAYVIAPPVRWLSAQRFGGRSLPRWGSVLVLYAAAGVVVFVGGRIFVPQLYKEVTRLAKESSEVFHQLSDDNIAKKAKQLGAWIEQNDLPIHLVTAEDEEGAPELDVMPGIMIDPALDPNMDAASSARDPRVVVAGGVIDIDIVAEAQDLIRNAKRVAREAALNAVGQVQSVVAAAVRFLFSTFLVLMLTAFIVADTERLVSFVFTITPVRDRETVQRLMTGIDRGLSGVVRGQLTICVINGLLTLVGLLLLKVKFAFLLATVAAVFSLIPIFGSILSTIPIVIVGLSSGLSTALLAVLWIVGIHALEANVLNPKIMGDAAKIHPVLVVLALVVGERFYGLAGALFAVPLMSVFVTIWKAVQQRAMRLDADIDRSVPAGPAEEPGPRPKRLRHGDGG